jgi:hypothetical protein
MTCSVATGTERWFRGNDTSEKHRSRLLCNQLIKQKCRRGDNLTEREEDKPKKERGWEKRNGRTNE